jgi:hypothetical protein
MIQENKNGLGKGEVGGSIPLGSTSFPQQNQRENCGPKASIAARNRFKHQNIPRIARIIRAKFVQCVLLSFPPQMPEGDLNET